MYLDDSIDYLLRNGSVVVKYRLHKDILRDLDKTAEENLLEQVCRTPKYRLVERYQKDNGYIGIGMPITPYDPDRLHGKSHMQLPNNRRILLDIARIGIGDKVDVTRQTAAILEEALNRKPFLTPHFENSYEKRMYRQSLMVPGPYSESSYAEDRLTDTDLACDFTLWAVLFLHEYHAGRSS